MAFGIGFVAAIVALRKKNGETRLRTLQKRLKQKPPPRASLYQYPVQRLLLLLFVVVVMGSLEWIYLQAKSELQQHLLKSQPLPMIQEPTIKQGIYFVPNKQTNVTGSHLQLQTQITRKITSIRRTVNCIHTCFVLALVSLLLSLKLKVVYLRRGQSIIKATNYRFLGLMAQKEQYTIGQDEKIGICQMGQTRFTNTNYYYEVRILGKEGKYYSVIEKSCMFDARDAAIRIADQLGVKYSTKIRKPIKNAQKASE